jgi:hypothetical protein
LFHEAEGVGGLLLEVAALLPAFEIGAPAGFEAEEIGGAFEAERGDAEAGFGGFEGAAAGEGAGGVDGPLEGFVVGGGEGGVGFEGGGFLGGIGAYRTYATYRT